MIFPCVKSANTTLTAGHRCKQGCAQTASWLDGLTELCLSIYSLPGKQDLRVHQQLTQKGFLNSNLNLQSLPACCCTDSLPPLA